jgi:alpha-beta hydrolase superfamily lysophospholipase
VDTASDFHLYDIDYYERKLDVIELLNDGEYTLGDIKVKRQYVTKDHEKETFLFHTNVKSQGYTDSEMKATLIIIHGFAESSDLFLESALHYAANGIDVHMIDLTGYGFSSGTRMAANSIEIFQEDLAFLFNLVNPSLPLFVYGHSMGGLTVASFLINNPNLKIAGAVLSAPLL